jgi:two-component system chemotaxis response regulator CheY
MDGIQALELIMSTYPEVLVIMLTSVATREVVERCLELGAVNFIRKDTPAEAITKVIADTYKQFVEHR